MSRCPCSPPASTSSFRTVEYSASLRLPNSRYSTQEKRARAHETLDVLRLEKCRDTKIGDGEHRGVSGGERKRVSIGVELVSDVSVLMLDEPSSGLDAFAAGNVVSAIKDATRARKLATLMTIHVRPLVLLSAPLSLTP